MPSWGQRAGGLVLVGGLLIGAPVKAETADEAAAAEMADRLQSKIDRRDYEAAADLAHQHEMELAGLPTFDLVAGLAHLYADRPDRAVHYFERVVLVDPGHDRGRLELARALFAVGDYEAARGHFETVMERNPPEPVAARAQRFIAAIDQRLADRQASFTAWVEGRFGYDDNVLASSDDILEITDPLEIVTIGIDDTSESDLFLEGLAGLHYATPWVDDRQWRYQGRIQQRAHDDFDLVDLTLLDASAHRVERGEGGSEFHLGGGVQHVRLDQDHLRTQARFAPQWRRMLNPALQARLEPRLVYSNFDDDDRDALGAHFTGSLALSASEDVLILARAGTGLEEAREDLYSRNQLEFGGMLHWRLDAEQSLNLNGVVRRYYYREGASPDQGQLLLARGGDESAESATLRQVTATYAFEPAESPWRFTLTLSHSEKNSNIAARSYERNQLFAGVRYNWN